MHIITLPVSKNKRIAFWTMWISHRHYLNEVPVEGKKNIRFLRRLGNWEQYLFQIIRTGNCVSLLSTPYSITEESFSFIEKKNRKPIPDANNLINLNT